MDSVPFHICSRIGRRTWRVGLIVGIVAGLLGILVGPAHARFPLTFRLDDQLEHHHEARTLFSKGRPVIFLGGAGRKTKEAMKKWLGPLRKKFGAHARIVGYVDLRGVPFFVPNALVRRGLRKAFPKLVVLCDYKGKAVKSLGFLPKTLIRVRVFDGQGHLRGGVVGPFSVARLTRLEVLVKGASRSAVSANADG